MSSPILRFALKMSHMSSLYVLSIFIFPLSLGVEFAAQDGSTQQSTMIIYLFSGLGLMIAGSVILLALIARIRSTFVHFLFSFFALFPSLWVWSSSTGSGVLLITFMVWGYIRFSLGFGMMMHPTRTAT